jgi:glutaminyl-tRNA synthetase
MRRRGFTSPAVRDFIDRVGVSKADSVVDCRLLDYCVRNDLNEKAMRAMAVLDPVRVVLTNVPEGTCEMCTIENHPKHPEMGTHEIPFTREIYIEREDFMIDAPKKFFRLKPDGEVRLKGAYIIRCERYDVDADGNVTCLYCTIDPESRSGSAGADRKVKGTIHWVSATQSIPFEGRLYDSLVLDDAGETEVDAEDDSESEGQTNGPDFLRRLNPDSLKVVHGYAEPWLAQASVGDSFQFLRMGYFCKDKDSTDSLAVFNRVVPLKDSYKPE